MRFLLGSVVYFGQVLAHLPGANQISFLYGRKQAGQSGSDLPGEPLLGFQ